MTDFPRLFAGVTAHALAALLQHVSPGGRAWLARRMVCNRRNPSSAALADFAQRVTLAWANAQFDINLNGEFWLLERLSQFAPQIIFDVGANIGEWSEGAAKTNPQATIHAFEIMDLTAKKLVRRVGQFGSRIVANQFGLSGRDGEITVFYRAESDVHTSTFKEAHSVAAVVETMMPVRSGDGYLLSVGIERIDLLKIDVEGHEWEVLDGFSDTIRRGAIDVIQFEYNKSHAILARRYLRDFYVRLDAAGYVIGKLYPNEVRFKAYELGDEDFAGPNYVACRRERTDIINALRGTE